MIGSSPLLLVLPLLGSGVRTDFASAIYVEARAGVIPVEYDAPAQPALIGTTTLLTGMRTRSRRTSFDVSYAPRLYFQEPNVADSARPLLYHYLTSRYDTALSSRLSFNANLQAGAGEVSYNSIQQYFDPGTSTVRTRFVQVLETSGTSGLGYRVSQRNTLGASVFAGYRSVLPGTESGQSQGSAPEAEDASLVVPTSFDVGTALTDIYTLTARDQLSFALRWAYVGADDDELSSSRDIYNVGADVEYARRLSETSEIRLRVGAVFTQLVEGGDPGIIPVANGTHVKRYSAWGGMWESTLSTGVQGFLDRVAVTYRAQGFASWNLDGSLGRGFASGLNIFVATSLDPEPVVPRTYETIASVTLPVTYVISTNAELRFGVSGGARAAHWADIGDPASQGEMTAFVGFRYRVGTDRLEGSWLR